MTQTDYLDRALKAANWFVNSQVRCEKGWKSDDCCTPYYYFMPGKKYVPGINWTHGRALFVLSEAYKITSEPRYLEAAERAVRFVMALQPLDPYYQATHGTFREETPQGDWGGILDGAQAASGLLMLHQVTGDPDHLRRGRAFCDFLLRSWHPEMGLPTKVTFFPEKVLYRLWGGKQGAVPTISHASAMPLWHLYKTTGEARYLPPLIDAADQMLKSQRPDGGMNFRPDVTDVEPPKLNHHHGLGEGPERYILRNDDGLVVLVLAAYQATGDRKYLDAMVRYADWIVENEPHERPYCAFGVQANNVLDIGRVAGKDYTSWVMKHLEERCLKLQVAGSGDPGAEGGFRGEDEEGDAGVFGGHALDYVPTRTTCYMSGLLFRLSGKGTGAGFSVFGLVD